MRRPLVTRAQPSSDGLVAAGNALREGEGLKLGGSIGAIKSHCKSMEGLFLPKYMAQAVPRRHLGALSDRKASQPLLMCLSCPWPAGDERVAVST